jgi:hypothetical protein
MDRRQWIPVGGLFATMAVASYMVVQLHAQAVAPTDLTDALNAEVHDAQGQVVLQGQFMAPVDEDGGVERRATLMPTGVDADAAGDAEVEFDRTNPTEQEVEFSVSRVQPGATYTFVIDGTTVGTATANRRGNAELELDIRMPGASASR